LRQRWYPGPKEGLAWLAENNPDLYRHFDAALKPGAPLAKIEKLVEAVLA